MIVDAATSAEVGRTALIPGHLRAGIRSGRRPLTCYHEAGHCLTRWYFGHYFDRALVLTIEDVARGVRPQNRRGVPVKGVEGFVDGYDLGPSLDRQTLEVVTGTPGRGRSGRTA